MENFLKKYSKEIIKLMFDWILVISDLLFNMKWIQNLVNKITKKYWKQAGKTIWVAFELAIVTWFYLLCWLAINKLWNTDAWYLLLILQPLQLIINKYQRNLDNNLKKIFDERN